MDNYLLFFIKPSTVKLCIIFNIGAVEENVKQAADVTIVTIMRNLTVT